MNKILDPKSWQIKWISIGLFFIIPLTIQLGIEFLYPSISHETIHQAKMNYWKTEVSGYNKENYNKNPDKYHDLWDSSDTYQKLQQEDFEQRKFYVLIINLFILLLSLISLIIKTPYIRTAFIGSVIIIAISNINFWDLYNTNFDSVTFFNLPITLISILTLFISLITIMYMASRDKNI